LTAEELTAVLQAASGSEKASFRDRALILTIVYGALRRSEVASLEVGDLRPLGRHWILDLDAAAGTGGAYARIPEPLAEQLERVTDVFGITKGPFWRSVSNRSHGEPLTPNGIYRIVRETGRQADLEALNINTLRRTGLNLALQGGASLSQVQAFGRYKDSSSVSDLSVPDVQSGGLSDNAAGYIDFDLKTVIESL
jgi:integrase